VIVVAITGTSELTTV